MKRKGGDIGALYTQSTGLPANGPGAVDHEDEDEPRAGGRASAAVLASRPMLKGRKSAGGAGSSASGDGEGAQASANPFAGVSLAGTSSSGGANPFAGVSLLGSAASNNSNAAAGQSAADIFASFAKQPPAPLSLPVPTVAPAAPPSSASEPFATFLASVAKQAPAGDVGAGNIFGTAGSSAALLFPPAAPANGPSVFGNIFGAAAVPAASVTDGAGSAGVAATAVVNPFAALASSTPAVAAAPAASVLGSAPASSSNGNSTSSTAAVSASSDVREQFASLNTTFAGTIAQLRRESPDGDWSSVMKQYLAFAADVAASATPAPAPAPPAPASAASGAEKKEEKKEAPAAPAPAAAPTPVLFGAAAALFGAKPAAESAAAAPVAAPAAVNPFAALIAGGADKDKSDKKPDAAPAPAPAAAASIFGSALAASNPFAAMANAGGSAPVSNPFAAAAAQPKPADGAANPFAAFGAAPAAAPANPFGAAAASNPFGVAAAAPSADGAAAGAGGDGEGEEDVLGANDTPLDMPAEAEGTTAIPLRKDEKILYEEPRAKVSHTQQATTLSAISMPRCSLRPLPVFLSCTHGPARTHLKLPCCSPARLSPIRVARLHACLRLQMLRFDAATKEWRDLGPGCLRVLGVPKEDASASAGAGASPAAAYASARIAFSIPFSGKRERVLVSSLVTKDTKMEVAPGAGPNKPASLTMLLVVAKEGGTAALEKFVSKMRTVEQVNAIVDHVKRATA